MSWRLSLLTFFCACAGLTNAAEETLLTISGNLIDIDATIAVDSEPQILVNRYYALLPESLQEELIGYWRRMERRAEDYQVAYRSGDTAEINETLDDLSFYWASVRTLHAEEFTQAVIETLESAYAEVFPFIGIGDQ